MQFAAKAQKVFAARASRRSFSSDAGKLIQRRATTGSVSSVFYLKTLKNGGKQGKQQADFIENVFTGFVGIPIACLGLGGLYRMASDGKL